MVIRVIGPDGATVEFPDGTPQAVQEKALAEHYAPQIAAAKDKGFWNGVGAFAQSANKQAASGFGDIPVAAVASLIPGMPASVWNAPGSSLPEKYGAAYARNRKSLDEMAAADAVAHPIAQSVGGVAGSVAGAVLASKGLGAVGGAAAATNIGKSVLPVVEAINAAKGTKTAGGLALRTITSPLAQSVAAGAGWGAASGAGNAAPGSRLEGARDGAVIGGVTGGAFHGIVTGATPVLKKYFNAFAGKGMTQQALTQIRDALKRDGYDVTSPQGAAALQVELSKFAGKPVSLADVGANVRARTGVGLRTPSNAQNNAVDTVLDRQAGQADRLSTDIRATVAPRTDVNAIDDALVQQRADEALPLRQAALNEPTAIPNEALDNAVDQYTSFNAGPAEFDTLGRALQLGDHPYSRTLPSTVYRAMTFGTDAEAQAAIASGVNTRPTSFAPTFKIAREYHGLKGVPVTYEVQTPSGVKNMVFDSEYTGQGDDILLPSGKYTNSEVRTGFLADGRKHYIVSAGYEPDAMALPAVKARIPNDQVLQGLVRLPLVQKAIQGARTNAAAERDLANLLGQSTDHLPDFPQQGAALDMKALDYVKRHLDGEVSRAFASTDSAAKAQAPQIKAVRDALRDRMKAISPDYAQYLDAYKGQSDLRDALAAGRKFDTIDPEVIASEQAGRTAGEGEMFRVGAARRLEDIVRGTNDTGTANPANRILNTPEARARIGGLGLEPGNAARLEQSVGQERQLSRLTREVQGSETDARLAARASADSLPSVPNPSFFSVAGNLGRKVVGNVNLTRNAKINEEALPRLLEQGPEAVKKIIAELQANGQQAMAGQLRRQAQARFGSGFLGRVIGSVVGQ